MADDIKHGKLSQITRGITVTDLVRVGGCASEDYFLFHRPVSRVRRTNPSGFVNKAISKNLNQNFSGLSLHVDGSVGNPFTDGVLVYAHHFSVSGIPANNLRPARRLALKRRFCGFLRIGG